MDREPKAPPFPLGTRLRYTGTYQSNTYDIDPITRAHREVPLCAPGMVVLIDKVHEGHRGTLVHLVDHDGPLYYDDDQPILDTTVDGWSVYHVQAWQGGIQQGRVIDHESKHEWEVIQ